ncbi:MAG: RNHCP domain-containing protein [bacterium]
MAKQGFQKRIEDFNCAHCGNLVKGTGYTDHCPKCLWSRHIDILPGDRNADCGGMMKPIGITVKNSNYIIYYQCEKCGYKYRVKSAPDDNSEELIELVSQSSKQWQSKRE